LENATTRLQNTASSEGRQAVLADAAAALNQLVRDGQIAKLQAFLRSGKDANLGASFEIGTGGTLQGAPTMRVWLLDQIATIHPAAAAEISREILADHHSPDEWAIALRNLARVDRSDASRQFLAEKFREMIADGRWRVEPSTGYLQAFDVAVFLENGALAPLLASLAADRDQPAVAHAAYLALDRLAIRAPGAVAQVLVDQPDLLSARPETRASIMARADPLDPAQLRLVESYLLASASAASELDAFASIFPNGNAFVSPNLLTTDPTFEGKTLHARDRAAFDAVNQWLEDPRFAGRRESLLRLRRRLLEFHPEFATPPAAGPAP
jgi:hypothetical protein